jgi:hypothetical protein
MVTGKRYLKWKINVFEAFPDTVNYVTYAPPILTGGAKLLGGIEC